MSQPILAVEGRRVYIKTVYGDPCVPKLKQLGAHWDADTKRWWITSAKKSEVEMIIKQNAGKKQEVDPKEITVIGKARYKGKNFYVRWVGQTKTGEYKSRLCSIDGKIDFWAKTAQPHEFHVTGDGDVAKITKQYQEPRSLSSIKKYADRMQQEKIEPKPDRDCYRSGNNWLVKGCAACRSAGTMCHSCQHDVFDY